MRFIAALCLFAAVGCSPVDYVRDVEPVQGNSVYVDVAVIGNCHAELDKVGTEKDIRAQAENWLKRYAYTVVQDRGSADLVLKAEVAEFHLGSRAARVLVGAGQAWHDTTIQIETKSGGQNAARRRAEVSAGAYNNFKGAEAHRKAVVDEIGKMHVWIAEDYLKP